MIEQILFALLVLTLVLVVQVYRRNKLMDVSWERMHNEFLRSVQSLDSSPMGLKNFYSQRLLSRLIPAFNHAKTFDNGYHHNMMFKVSQ